ncbi:MAG TPA: hypothetical protein VMU69_32890 [Bradyrhizobium sp.]|nr:hypothetical protein [Bradyrhizobium sp.]
MTLTDAAELMLAAVAEGSCGWMLLAAWVLLSTVLVNAWSAVAAAEWSRSVVGAAAAVAGAGVAAEAPAFVVSVVLPELSCLLAVAFCCAVAAVGSVLPELSELSEALAVVCDCVVDEALASPVFGGAVVVGTAGVGVAVATVAAVGSPVPLMPVCTVACSFVTAAALPSVVGWVAPFASVLPAVVDVVPDVAAPSSVPVCAAAGVADVPDVDWSAAARAAAAMASGAVLGPPLVPVVGAVVGAVGAFVSVTVTGSMTAIAVGTMPVVTAGDGLAVEPLVESVVVLPSDDDCVLDVEESSFESSDLLRECRGPSLPLVWLASSALEVCPAPLP